MQTLHPWFSTSLNPLLIIKELNLQASGEVKSLFGDFEQADLIELLASDWPEDFTKRKRRKKERRERNRNLENWIHSLFLPPNLHLHDGYPLMPNDKVSNADVIPTNIAKSTRRNFLRSGALGVSSLGFTPVPTIARGRLEKPTLLGIGAGGKGKTDLSELSAAGFDVVGLCDVVDVRKFDGKLSSKNQKRLKGLAAVRDAYPQATFGSDYREMLEQLGNKVDAIVVATPDHHHFHASVLGMQAGKHVYCQKPLTHGIWEARMMKSVSESTGVKTQMGNQAHAHDHMRRCVELLRAGVIGKIKAIHTWTNRPIWPQGFATPPVQEKMPAGLDWKQWTGPAPAIAYNSVIAPFSWRGWWNYGTGALGDMACHIMDMGYWALNPGAPRSVRAVQSGATKFSPPVNSMITWKFAPNRYSSKDGFTINWYDGYVDAEFERSTWELKKHSEEYNHPSSEVLGGANFEDFGSVVIGEEGKLFFNRQQKKGKQSILFQSNGQLDRFAWPEKTLPRARNQNNYVEFYDAVVGDIDQAQSHFGHAGPFTETILLGVLAQHASALDAMNNLPPQELAWDSQRMIVPGRKDLTPLVQREYTQGWELKPEV